MNHLGLYVAGKRKCRAVAIKDDKEKIFDKLFFDNDKNRIPTCFQEYSHREKVLLKSSLRIYRKHVDENS